MNNKEDMKEKNLKQIGIIVVLIILLALIGYAIFPNKEELQTIYLLKIHKQI